MKEDSGYTIERVSPKNLHDLVSIFKASFGQSVRIDQLQKKMNTDFAGVSYVGFIAYAIDRTPAAFYGVFPVDVIVGGRKIRVAQSGDTMTHPHHQGKGLFVKLAKMTYDLCKNEEIYAVFGFPSASSYPGFTKKLNWQHVDNLEKFTFWVPSFPIAEIGKFIPILAQTHLWIVSILFRNLHHITHFEGSVTKSSQDGVLRSEGYLAYKKRNGNVFYLRLRDRAVVALRVSNVLGIGDLQSSNVISSMRKIRWLAFLTGFNRVVVYASPSTHLALKLRELSNSTKGLPIGFLNFSSEIDIKSVQYTYLDFDTF